ncbi:MAG TPA: hypothetical protein VGD76_09170 [Ramlibacter sp.]
MNQDARTGMWKKALRAGLLCVPAMVLVACGGGGGGTTGAATAPAVAITTSNAQAVAAEASEVSTNTDAAAAGSLVTGVQVDGTNGSDTMLLVSAARKLLARPAASGSLATGAAVSQACTGGGSMTMDATVSGSGALAAGDSFQISANNCTESDGVTTMVMNGSIAITIVSGTYDLASATYPKSVTMRIVTTNFSVSSGGETEVFNGDLTIALTETSATSASVTLTAASLSNNIGSHTVTVTNYTLQVTESPVGVTTSITATVQTNNSRLGSGFVSYTITTLTPITVSSTGVVTAGSIKVTGANSSLVLTVTGPDTYSLQVDTNGDGSFESTSTVTRSELQALI